MSQMLSANTADPTLIATCVGLIFLSMLGTAPLSAQVLDELRYGVRNPKPHAVGVAATQPAPPQTRKQFNRERREDGRDDGLSSWLVAGVAAAPYWGPRILAHDEGRDASFCSCPYSEADDVGIITSDWLKPTHRKTWMTRTRIEYADDFDDLTKIGGQLLIDSASRFGFDTEFNHFREGFMSSQDDSLQLGDVNFVYRFAQSERLQMRSGIGFNWLNDDIDSEFGFNFTYGGDWFPIRPWVVSTEFDFGRLGHARLFHGRATVGVQMNHVELFVGFDYLDVRDAQAGSFVTGLRFWF